MIHFVPVVGSICFIAFSAITFKVRISSPTIASKHTSINNLYNINNLSPNGKSPLCTIFIRFTVKYTYHVFGYASRKSDYSIRRLHQVLVSRCSFFFCSSSAICFFGRYFSSCAEFTALNAERLNLEWIHNLTHEHGTTYHGSAPLHTHTRTHIELSTKPMYLVPFWLEMSMDIRVS